MGVEHICAEGYAFRKAPMSRATGTIRRGGLRAGATKTQLLVSEAKFRTEPSAFALPRQRP